MLQIKNPVLPGFNADPSIIRVDDTYYIANSTFEWFPGVRLHESKDLVHWNLLPSALSTTTLLDMKGNPSSGGIWAPDLSYADGKFWLIYTDVKVTDGSFKDCINYLITAEDIRGPWSDPIVLNTAGFDASLFHDEDGRKYLINQYWDPRSYHHPFYGIMCTEFSEEEGKLIGEPWVIYKGTEDKFTEGPHLYQWNGYYYLFVSYGDLQSDGGYQIRQFRSEKPTGPYVDVAGNTLEDQDDHFNYGLKMMGNYTFPSLNYTYMAPGGQSTFQDDDGKYYITYHQRFDDGTEYHEPRVHQMYTNEDGWFVAAPFATMGETLSEKGYKKSDVSGTFYVVNHGTDISSKIREAEAYAFADGKVTGGEKSGTYEVKEGTDYITITLDGVVYKGVLMEMTDEAENPVFCFLSLIHISEPTRRS